MPTQRTAAAWLFAAGTVAVSGQNVTGVGANFLVNGIRPSDILFIAGYILPIATVPGDTAMTLAFPSPAAVAATASYAILRQPGDSVDLSAAIRELLNTYPDAVDLLKKDGSTPFANDQGFVTGKTLLLNRDGGANEAVRGSQLAPPNLFDNAQMRINIYNGEIDEIGETSILPRPYRVGTGFSPIQNPDMTWASPDRHYPMVCDRWQVFINAPGQTGGLGWAEQVYLVDAPVMASATAYGQGAFVRAGSSGFGSVDGPYAYRSVAALSAGRTNNASFAADAIEPLLAASFERRPKNWGLCGLYETDTLLANTHAIRWRRTAASSGAEWLSQMWSGVDIVGKGGVFSFGINVRNRLAGAVTIYPQVYIDRGVGTTGIFVSGAAQNITQIGQRLTWELTIPDPSGTEVNINLNARDPKIEVRWIVASASGWDILFSRPSFRAGRGMSDFVAVREMDDRNRCAAYAWKTGANDAPFGLAYFITDAVSGVAQNNSVKANNIYDAFGRMRVGVIDWTDDSIATTGIAGRAYPGNEREFPNAVHVAPSTTIAGKATPSGVLIPFPRMVRKPTPFLCSIMEATPGYGDYNNARQRVMKRSHTGAGSAGSGGAYAQRAVCPLAVVSLNDSRALVNTQNLAGAAAWLDLTTPTDVPADQDAVGVGFPTMRQGEYFHWTWYGMANGWFALVISLTGNYRYGGSLTTITGIATGAYADVGRVYRQASSYACWQLVRANTLAAVPPTEPNLGWRRYGVLPMPYQVEIEGNVLTRSALADPATTSTGRAWAYYDPIGFGFDTLCVRLNGGGTPGAGTVKALPHDAQLQSADVPEQIYFHALFNAQPLVEVV